MNLIIVRHGETVDNTSRTFQQPSSPLSQHGEQQAALLARRLADFNVSKIICSDYLRTQQTAAPIAAALGLEVSLTPLLRERNFGDLRGYPYLSLDFDPFAVDYEPVNGESWGVFNQRAGEAWLGLLSAAKNSDANIIAVTHGFMCRALIANHALLPDGIELPTHWGNTSLTIINQDDHQVTTLNCTAHLDGHSLDRQTSGQV